MKKNEPEQVEFEEDSKDPKARRQRAMNEIAERRDQELREQVDPMRAHNDAVDAFDYKYKDITSNPVLLREAIMGHHRIASKGGMNGQAIDWPSALAEMGDEIRRKAGLSYGTQRERQEQLDEMRKQRGQPRSTDK